MAMIKKSITVTDQQEQWIQSQIASGDYASDSELLRDLIRKEQARSAEIQAIRAKLIHAEQRGFTDKTPQDILQDVIKRKQKNGEL